MIVARSTPGWPSPACQRIMKATSSSGSVCVKKN
jgi:hypothetical protein